MKTRLVIACIACGLAAAWGQAALPCRAVTHVELPELPVGEMPNTEVVTNLTLAVDATRLETVRFALAVEPGATNELCIAVGTDADGNGDLSLEEAAFWFGCDCGEWFLADAATGEVRRDVGNSLTIGKRQFDPRWDTLKIVKRGLGEVAHSVVQDVENIRFVISVR